MRSFKSNENIHIKSFGIKNWERSVLSCRSVTEKKKKKKKEEEEKKREKKKNYLQDQMCEQN